MRLRPIIMTSMAFVLGVLPLALASGAGSASQNEIGIAVIGGMLAATFLAPFLIPMFFFVVTGKLFKPKTESAPALPGPAALESEPT
jgi:multidrug efflux pump